MNGENALISVQRALRTVPAKMLSLVPRAVLLALAGRANEEWIAWPSLGTIAADAGATLPTVRRAVDELIRLGWVEIVTQATPRDSARLRVHAAPFAHEGVKLRYPRGQGALPLGSSSVTPGVTDVDPRDQAPRGQAALPQGSSSDQSGVKLLSARGKAPLPEDPNEDHKEDPIEDPRIKPPPLLNNQTGTLFAELDPPKTDPPKVKRKPPTKRPRNPEVPPVPLEALNRKERATYDAIVTDPSLRPICLGPVQLAIDLTAIGSLIDVPAMIRRAGSWMREDPRDPRRRKTNGNAYLANWITREQERVAAIPRPAEPPGEERRKPPKTPGIPRDVLEGVERMNREGIVVDPAAALAKLELIGR